MLTAEMSRAWLYGSTFAVIVCAHGGVHVLHLYGHALRMPVAVTASDKVNYSDPCAVGVVAMDSG